MKAWQSCSVAELESLHGIVAGVLDKFVGDLNSNVGHGSFRGDSELTAYCHSNLSHKTVVRMKWGKG